MRQDEEIELRKILIEAMSYRAEKLSQLGCGHSFKPGIADKFLFNRIIDSVIDKIEETDFRLMRGLINNGARIENRLFDFKQYVGIGLMKWFYCPQYSWWDKKELKEAKLT